MTEEIVLEKNEALMERINNIKDYLSQKGNVSAETAINQLKFFLKMTSRYHYFNYVPDTIRYVLVLINDTLTEGQNSAKLHNAAAKFAMIQDLILAMKPPEVTSDSLRRIISVVPYDLDSQTMKFHWKEQYTFEESIFYPDDHLKPFIDKFLDELDPTRTWYQIYDFSKNCAQYLQDAYSITEDQPQILAFSSRALYQIYFKFAGPIFTYHPTDEKFLNQISYLRTLTPSDLMIREKFLPDGTHKLPINQQLTTLYSHTVGIANFLPFDDIPDDLFYHISILHDTVFEELISIMYQRTDKKIPLSQYRATAALGQEDVMPIIILVLVLADIPNLPDIVNFFNEYTTQIDVNSKSGLYMANIATAFGAIMNWEKTAETN